MKKLLFVSTLCLSSVFAFSGKAQEKSIIEQEKPKPISIKYAQQNTIKHLKDGGNYLVGGVLLYALGSFIASRPTTNKNIGIVMQVGAGAAVIYSGYNFANAAKYYEKSIKEVNYTENVEKK